jgi:hypothetical protein
MRVVVNVYEKYDLEFTAGAAVWFSVNASSDTEGDAS